MNHEDHPSDPERHEQHPHVAKRPGEAGSRDSSPTESDEKFPVLSEGQPEYRTPGQQEIPGLGLPGGVTEWRFEGPTPMPQIIEWHNRIKPGSGDRIMDDAHEDMKLDREITRSSFKYAIHESKARLYTAISICIAAVGLIPLFLFTLDPPESIVGAGAMGLVALTPLVNTLLNNHGGDQKNEK